MKRVASILLLAVSLAGCKTQYVPVESVRTEYRDRWRTDSVYNRDSIFLSVRGDTVWMEKYITRYRDRVVRDSLVRVDSIPVLFEVEKRVYVEKPLSWWQSFFVRTGKALWGVLVLFILYRTNKRFGWISRLPGRK